MSSTWNGDVTFVAQDMTSEGFQVTAFADAVERDRFFNDHGDVTATSALGVVEVPLLVSDQVGGLIVTFGGADLEDPLSGSIPDYQPSAQSDGGSAGTGYTFKSDTVFALIGATGLNAGSHKMTFNHSGGAESTVRCQWVGGTIVFP